MKRAKLLVIISASTLLLSGCNNKSNSINSNNSTNSTTVSNSVNSNTNSNSVNSDTVSSNIKTDSTSIINRGSWSDEAKTLLLKYCGEVLPYPLGFTGDVYVNEIDDTDNNAKYLQIVNKAKKFTLDEYYKDLDKAGWTGIKNYEGSVAQTDSYGTKYFEYTNVSSDKTKGYDLTYYFHVSSDTGEKYNVIQCYNDLTTSAENKTEWTDEEKEMFNSALTFTPTVVKLGGSSNYYATSEDYVCCEDLCALDFTLDNVKILQDDGWTIDTQLSENNETYILKKTAADGATVYAKVYYFSKNYVKFFYYADVKESTTWPTSFVSSFENTYNFTIPQFSSSDMKKYYYYTKNSVSYIYGYTDSNSIYSNYLDSMNNANAIYDNINRLYTDWEEKWYLKPESTINFINYKNIFRISFSNLTNPVDTIVSSYPSDKVNSFLSTNNLTIDNVPTFDFSNYSTYSSYRVEEINYTEAYKEAYKQVKKDPDYYDIDDPTDKNQIIAKAEEVAKSNTKISIKVFDKATTDSSNNTVYKVYDYLESALKKICWSTVNGNGSYDMAYEDPTGKVLLGVSRMNNVTTITFTYGSGQTHSPAFYFATKDYSIEIGGTKKLNLVCDMLNGEITYTSSNSKFTVSNDGVVTASSECEAGDYTTITASILAEGETEARTDTCKLSIPFTYTKENTISKVAGFYNTYFNLSSTDAGYATPDSNNTLTLYPSSFTTIKDVETFVMNNLIPNDFYNGDETEWNTDSSTELGDFEYMEYTAYNEDDTSILLTFKAFTSTDGSIGIIVTAEDW